MQVFAVEWIDQFAQEGLFLKLTRVEKNELLDTLYTISKAKKGEAEGIQSSSNGTIRLRVKAQKAY